MKILVTGACGMIGYSLCERLLQEGVSVVGVDNFNDQFTYQGQALKSLAQYPRFEFIHQNITAYSIGQVDAVVHLAANPGIKQSFEHPQDTLNNNHLSFLHVLEHCRLRDTPVFFASSSSVYGNQTFLSENEPLGNILNIYALSKKYNEDVAKMYSQLYGVRAFALRFFTVYGEYARPDMLAHKIMDSICHGTKLTLYKNGFLQRDFTYVGDVARCITGLLQAQNNSQNKTFMMQDKYQVFNIGGSGSIEVIEFVRLFEHYLDGTANLKLIEEKPVYDAQKTSCNNQKLLEVLPDISFTSCQRGVAQTVQWYKNFKNI